MSTAAASPIVLHISDNPEEICTDFGPHLKAAETISSPVLVGYWVNGAVVATVTGLTLASLAVNTGTYTSPNGETVTANEGVTMQATPSAVGEYLAIIRATSSDTPRVPAITQPIHVRAE